MTFPCVFLGTLVEAIGIGLLGWAIWAEKLGTIFGMMALVGCGSGMRFMASPLHGIGLFKNLRASVIGLMAVAVPFGGTIGLTIMSTVFNNTSGIDSSSGDFTKVQSSSSSSELKGQAIHDAKMGVVWAFIAITPFVALVGSYLPGLLIVSSPSIRHSHLRPVLAMSSLARVLPAQKAQQTLWFKDLIF